MKIPKEHVLFIIVGLYLLSYLLEAVVAPLTIHLTTPYAFLDPSYLSQYPFTAATVLIRALALFLTPIFLMSFLSEIYFAKVGICLVVGALAQLYSLQEVATGTTLVPLEWSLSLSVAGACLVLPSVIYAIKGVMHSAKSRLVGTDAPVEDKSEDNL